MTVLGISGSLRKNGNTATLVNTILERAGGGCRDGYIACRYGDPAMHRVRDLPGDEVVCDGGR